MKTKNLFLFLCADALMMTGCNSGSLNTTTPVLKTASDTASYYLGYLQGSGVSQFKMKDFNMQSFVAGMNTGIEKKEIKASNMEMQMFLNNYFQSLQMKLAEDNKKESEEYLAKKAKESGVDTLGNGILYKVEKEGNGPKPTATDMVKVHYKGTLPDGTVFDSSLERKEPAEFALNHVIPGWSKALQNMPVGSKWIIFFPADEAYGSRGNRGIGPNQALTFEVELLDIVTPEVPEGTPNQNKK